MSEYYRKKQNVILIQAVIGSVQELDHFLDMLRDDLEYVLTKEPADDCSSGICLDVKNRVMDVEHPGTIADVPDDVWKELNESMLKISQECRVDK